MKYAPVDKRVLPEPLETSTTITEPNYSSKHQLWCFIFVRIVIIFFTGEWMPTHIKGTTKPYVMLLRKNVRWANMLEH